MGKSGLGSINVKAADEKAVKNEVQVLFNLRSIIWRFSSLSTEVGTLKEAHVLWFIRQIPKTKSSMECLCKKNL